MGGRTGDLRTDGGGVPAHGVRNGLRGGLRNGTPAGTPPEPRRSPPPTAQARFMNGMLPHVAPYDSSMAPHPAPLPDTPLRGLQSGSAQQPGRVPEWFRDSPAKRVTWVRFPPRPPTPLHGAAGREALPTEGLPRRVRPAHRPPSTRHFSGHIPDRSHHTCPGDDPTRCCSSSLRLSFTTRKPTPSAHTRIHMANPRNTANPPE